MSRRKKTKRHEEHIDESWLTPYSDILTLLLALFIVLFASSTVDSVKFRAMSSVFNQVFDGGTGVMDNPSVIESDNGKSTSSGMMTGKTEQEQLGDVQDKVNSYIKDKKLGNKLETA